MPLSVLFLLFITPGPASAPEGQLIKADFLPCHPGILLGENVNRKSKIIKTWEFVKKLAVWRGGRMRFPQLSAPDPHAQMLSSRDCTPRIHSLFLLQMQQGLSAPPPPPTMPCTHLSLCVPTSPAPLPPDPSLLEEQEVASRDPWQGLTWSLRQAAFPGTWWSWPGSGRGKVRGDFPAVLEAPGEGD